MADPKQQQPGDGKSSSKTVTDTIVGKDMGVLVCHGSLQRMRWLQTPLLSHTPGEHEHTIVGYSLIKGIGDGEPVASERFVVGGHEWVRLIC